jgi:hypothetical protein
MAMYPIATYTMAVGQLVYVDFANIPQIYEDLQIRYVTRDTDTCCPTRGMFMEINQAGFTSGGQHKITTTGNGTTVGVSNSLSITNRFDWSDIPGGIAVSNVFASGLIDISNYSNTSQLKSIQIKNGYVDGSNTGMVFQQANLWPSTAAINHLRLYSNQAFVNGSSLTLYGITKEEL